MREVFPRMRISMCVARKHPPFANPGNATGKGFLIPVNGEGKCVVARAHPESDSATDAGTNRCPQGVPKMSQIRSVGSGNVLQNANH